ncbi:E3 ubiquitin-protein ligase MPSR1-like [Rutidosis leptorrhynchoides]|uniref:E3 ubiquitin-protein ligase MPSR1-like n=1 Tax=Rutidosis leptorrhynchoides TaxID=125765 RepID=UPI003A9945F1
MSSETESLSVSPLIERLMGIQLFSSIATTRPDSDHQSENRQHPDRIIIINPATQGMVVIGAPTGFEAFINGLMDRKDGQPPASQTAINDLKSIEIKCTDKEEMERLGLGGSECVICMEEWGVGDVAKEMPCKHKFHSGCVEKWLKIHGTCPVCRYKMECDDDVENKNGEVEGERREVWVRVAIRSSNERTSSTREDES